jgi:hypothetical protein
VFVVKPNIRDALSATTKLSVPNALRPNEYSPGTIEKLVCGYIHHKVTRFQPRM